ncbi:lipase family protein [Nocardia sp. NPDC058058]|uniref:lipase family protein n=1 Tax=Nocardia sp. NPDC058058 TaxID=3346317 RepID=UPI0036DC1CAA
MRRTLPAVLFAAAVLLSGTAVATAAPEPVTPVAPVNPVPGIDRVFNGFVIGTLNTAENASPEEKFEALLANDPFYEEPALTGSEKPGTVLKSKPVDVMFLGVKPTTVDAHKLMYVTTAPDGVTPVISTGILMIPKDGKPAAERRLISYQEANDSVGWSCHPSTQWTGGAPLDGSSWSALGPLALMFDKGYAVMISDVGNDADRDPHGVFVGTYSGHAQLDGARAALRLPESGLSNDTQIALFGIAGGGVGAAFSAEMAPTYAPELDIKSTLLEGMVVDPANFMRVTSGSIGSGFALATLLGLEPWYPEMRVNDKLNPAGQALANFYRTQCQVPAYFGLPFVPMEALFTSGRNPADEPDFQRAFANNVLGRNGTPTSKIMISSCAKDDSPMSLVPAADARNLAETYRGQGADVTYAPTDCSMERFITDMYGWGVDLFGMQTIDWIDGNFE